MWELAADDERVAIGWIAGAVADEQDRFFLLDGQLCRIYVMDPSGELVAVLGREGAEREVLCRHQDSGVIEPYTLDEAALFVPWRQWAVLADGLLVHRLARDEYRLRVRPPSGEERDFTAWPYPSLSRDDRRRSGRRHRRGARRRRTRPRRGGRGAGR